MLSIYSIHHNQQNQLKDSRLKMLYYAYQGKCLTYRYYYLLNILQFGKQWLINVLKGMIKPVAYYHHHQNVNSSEVSQDLKYRKNIQT